MEGNNNQSIRSSWVAFIRDLQERICTGLAAEDGQADFNKENWQREETDGGGGLTRVIQNGNVFEKGGVNTSVVQGQVTDAMRNMLGTKGDQWFAAGMSIVIHPFNPFVPTIHCNYRMFELSDANGEVIDRWLGGGTDLTPYYLFEEDAKHFHQTYKDVCDRFDKAFYPTYKKHCDDYFSNHHRNNERRGIGGIFYDHLKPSPEHTLDELIQFSQSCGNAFLDAYLPIVQRRKNSEFTEQHKYWQEIRRGRYVEFNLVHDRGTLFGLKTGGRIESILMSLPPTVRFDYNYQPAIGSPEEKLLKACQQPVEWL